MVGKTALNKEMKHLNGAYFRTNSETCNFRWGMPFIDSAKQRFLYGFNKYSRG